MLRYSLFSRDIDWWQILGVVLLMTGGRVSDAAPMAETTARNGAVESEKEAAVAANDMDAAEANLSVTIIHNYAAPAPDTAAMDTWLPLLIQALLSQTSDSSSSSALSRNALLLQLLLTGSGSLASWNDPQAAPWDDWSRGDPTATHPLLDRRSL